MSKCSCKNNGTNLLYTCSGAANTGLAADKITRRLAKQGVGAMTCLVALGADLSGFIESAKAADKNIIIDGCPVACGKKVFERLKINKYDHYLITDEGVEKKKTKITEELIDNLTQVYTDKISKD